MNLTGTGQELKDRAEKLDFSISHIARSLEVSRTHIQNVYKKDELYKNDMKRKLELFISAGEVVVELSRINDALYDAGITDCKSYSVINDKTFIETIIVEVEGFTGVHAEKSAKTEDYKTVVSESVDSQNVEYMNHICDLIN